MSDNFRSVKNMNPEEELARLKNGRKARETAKKIKIDAEGDLIKLKTKGDVGKAKIYEGLSMLERWKKDRENAGKDFRDGLRVENYNVEQRIGNTRSRVERENSSRNNEQLRTERLTAPNGTARKLKDRLSNGRKKLSTKTVATVLGIAIGLGALTGVVAKGYADSIPEYTATDLNNMGIEMQIGQDTLNTMQKYDKFFENYNPKEANLSESEVLSIASDIRDLNFNVIKDKAADVLDLGRGNVDLSYTDPLDKEGSILREIKTKNGNYSNLSLHQTPEERSISPEIGAMIENIGYIDQIVYSIKDDSITKNRGVKRLEEVYNKITKFATRKMVMDEKGNISMTDYPELIALEEEKTNESSQTEKEER